MKFSFLKPPLQNYNGGLKYENFISYKNHIVRPIKWIEILSGLTLCCQKIGQTNLKNSLCKIKLKILNFSFFSKSAPGKIFYMMVLGLYTHDRCRNAKNRIVMSFLSQNLCETAVDTDCMLAKGNCKVVIRANNDNFESQKW